MKILDGGTIISSFIKVFTMPKLRIEVVVTLGNIKTNDSYKFTALIKLIKGWLPKRFDCRFHF